MADAPILRLPHTGTLWVWEIDKEYARKIVRVVEVRFNGEEWWVETLTLPDAPKPLFLGAFTREHPDVPEGAWNELDRFWEACRNSPIGGRLEDLSNPISETQHKRSTRIA